MHPRRSLVWLVFAAALTLGACFLLILPLSAAPLEKPRGTPGIVGATTASGTPTQTPVETGAPQEQQTHTPTETCTASRTGTGTPLPSLTPTSTNAALAAPSPTSMPFRNQIYVNEFLPQPVSDWNGDGKANTDDEWIELFNAGDAVVDIGGWMLDDVSGGGSAPYTIPGGAPIAARGFRVFFHSETKISLNDDGDDVRLLNPGGTVADMISYSSSRPDKSFGRFPDGDAFFTDDCAPSPGAANCSITPTVTPIPTPYPNRVVVNEFMPQPRRDWNGDGSKDSSDEWIELYNASGEAVDLGGWKLDDAEGGSSPYPIPLGTTINARAFLVFYGNQTTIGLNNDGDEVRLLHPDGTVADGKSYTSSAPDRAYGRRPDGGAKWQTGCYPTPGQSNCSVVITPTPTEVYHLTDFPKARTLPIGSEITVVGSVVARPCQLDQYAHEMMLSDGSSGLDVYLPYPEQLTCAMEMGEQVRVTGVITDHYGLIELQLESNRDVARNFGTPREIAPSSIHTDELDEEYESMPVTVQGTVVNGKNGDTIWVDDGDGAVEVLATQWSGASFAGITHGSIVRVTGVGYHNSRYTAPNEGYTLRPRRPQDVEVLKLAGKVPAAPGGYGKDLGAVSIGTAHTTRTGNYVLLGGVVIVPPGVIGARDFWIEDGSGGVHVYATSSAGEMPVLHLWDAVTVRGRVGTYYKEREVRVEEPSGIGVFGVGAPIAAPSVRTGALTLKNEGALVEIAGAVKAVQGRDIYVEDGSGEALVYLDSNTHLGVAEVKVGDALRVAGVVRRYEGRAELVPRYAEDLIVEGKRRADQGAGGVEGNAGENATGADKITTGGDAALNASEGRPQGIALRPTLTASPSATATPTVQVAVRTVRRPASGAGVLTSQAGLSMSDNRELAFAAALLLIFSAAGGMAVAALLFAWKYRQVH